MSFDYTQPVRLEPVCIPKPWGQEIWFTGMEARGESQVSTGAGETVPLSVWLSADADASSRRESVLLLKILDPAPVPITGDLYFEVHSEKREVYVVTHIDPTAWPGGAGAIRFGMNQRKRLEHADDESFRSSYLQVVQSYEKVRRAIDSGTESPFIVMQEMALRERMESFSHLRELHIGDVVHVPTWFPHALQHGVRVVEFQTATYERLIVSFAQKVLTQDHWNTAAAVAGMSLDPGTEQNAEVIAPGIERIARFDHFNVWRADGRAGEFFLPPNIPYVVLMAVGGNVRAGGLILDREQAAFVPCSAITNTRLHVDAGAQVLLAAPGL
jgi:hypothetical protein